jgi:hypothetical protein
MFPQPLVSCILEGRCPEEHEVAAIASKLWDEGLYSVQWGEPQVVTAMARAALSGCGSTTTVPSPEETRA